jgi:hypothetical protein
MYFVYAGNAAAPATISAALNNGDGTFAAAVPVSYTPQQNGGYPAVGQWWQYPIIGFQVECHPCRHI